METNSYIQSKDGTIIYASFFSDSSVMHPPKDKPVILLSHGFAMDTSSWHHQIQAFKEDYSIVAYDLRGHGKSGKPKGKDRYSLENFLNDIDTVANNLKLDKFNMLGFSIGASISLRYAQLHPERLEKIVAINPPYNIDSIRPSFFQQLAIAMNIPKLMIGIGLDKKPIWDYQGKMSTYRKCFLSMEKQVIEDSVAALREQKPEPLTLAINHLIIHSKTDELVKPEPPSSSNHVFIEGGDHYVIAQKYRKINRLIRGFLQK